MIIVLKVLEGLGEIQALRTDRNRTFFDPRTDPHRHFCCQKCGNVIDIETEDARERELDGHLIEVCQVYYHGVCAGCRMDEGDS